MFDINKIIKKSKNNSMFNNFNFNTPISNPINNFKGVGASPKMQKMWGNMSPQKRNVLRKILPDNDGDRVPNIYDCQPNNVMRQDWKLPEGFNQKTGVDKYGRKIVYIPTEEMYNMRGRYGIDTASKRDIIIENSRDIEKKLGEDFGFQKKWNKTYKENRKIIGHNKAYDIMYKEKNKDILDYRSEIEKNILESKGKKVYPHKLKYERELYPKTTLHSRYTPNKYKKQIAYVMQPSNSSPGSHGDRKSNEVSEYYNKLKNDLEYGEVPVPSFSAYEISEGRIGEARHRILAARELGISHIPIIVDEKDLENSDMKRKLKNYDSGLDKTKHITNKEKGKPIEYVEQQEYIPYGDLKKESEKEIEQKYKSEYDKNKESEDDDEEIRLLLLKHKILNEEEQEQPQETELELETEEEPLQIEEEEENV